MYLCMYAVSLYIYTHVHTNGYIRARVSVCLKICVHSLFVGLLIRLCAYVLTLLQLTTADTCLASEHQGFRALGKNNAAWGFGFRLCRQPPY